MVSKGDLVYIYIYHINHMISSLLLIIYPTKTLKAAYHAVFILSHYMAGRRDRRSFFPTFAESFSLGFSTVFAPWSIFPGVSVRILD